MPNYAKKKKTRPLYIIEKNTRKKSFVLKNSLKGYRERRNLVIVETSQRIAYWITEINYTVCCIKSGSLIVNKLLEIIKSYEVEQFLP